MKAVVVLAFGLGLIGLATAGCGDPLIPGDVVRLPIFTVGGATGADLSATGSLRVAALWVDPLGQLADRPWPIAGVRSQPTTTDHFQLDFSSPPPPEMIRRIPSSTDPSVTVVAFAFAEIVAFDDLDGDGTLHVGPVAQGSRLIGPDVYRGAAVDHALIYVEQPHPPPVIPELDAILGSSVGYHLAVASCDPTTTSGQFLAAPQGDQFLIKLGEPQSTVPEVRGCLHSHVPASTP